MKPSTQPQLLLIRGHQSVLKNNKIDCNNKVIDTICIYLAPISLFNHVCCVLCTTLMFPLVVSGISFISSFGFLSRLYFSLNLPFFLDETKKWRINLHAAKKVGI